MMSEPLDQSLPAAIAGDTAALSHLLALHGPAVQQQLRISPQWQSMIEPEDVMQVTYLEAFMQIARFDPKRSSFQNWLNHIAQNNLRDAVRGLSRQKQPQPSKRVTGSIASNSNGESFVHLLDSLGAVSHTPSRAASFQETQSLIESALSQLPADYAKVIHLYDLQGFSIAEVAAEMRRSSGAVHMLRARAHDCLRTVLGRESMFFSQTGVRPGSA